MTGLKNKTDKNNQSNATMELWVPVGGPGGLQARCRERLPLCASHPNGNEATPDDLAQINLV